MNQYHASPNQGNFVLEFSNRANAQASAESQSFFLQKARFPAFPMIGDTMAIWSSTHNQNGVAIQPWDGAAVFPGSIKHHQAEQAQTAQAVEDAIIAERNRLARELHDAVTQTLFAASLIAEVLPDLWDIDEAEARRSTEELRQLTRGALAEMRTLLFELRPAALSQARLSDLLRQLSEAVTGRKRLPVYLHVDGDCEMPCDVKVEIYRIAQESLNNIVKYARATRVDITIRLQANQVHMEIKDNGIGFDPTDVKPTSLGLRIMRERAEAIHAQVQVTSQPGSGAIVSLDWNK